MKFFEKIGKWVALALVVGAAMKAFYDTFKPKFDEWRETYPPEADPVEEVEEDSDEPHQPVTLVDPNKAAEAMSQAADDFEGRGGDL